MYIGQACLSVSLLCLCLCLSVAACPHYCTDPDVSWRNGRGCLLVVHYWADLQSVHGFRCYDNIQVCKHIALYTENAYSAEREMSASTYVLVLALCLLGLAMLRSSERFMRK